MYGNAFRVDSDGSYSNTRAEIHMASVSDTEWGGLETNVTARYDRRV